MVREKTGRGQIVDASFFDTAIFFMSPFIAGHALTGYVTPKMGSGSPVFTPYQCFETADKYIFIGVTSAKFWQAFCAALGLNDLADDPRYSSMENRLLHRNELVDKIANALKKLPGNEVLQKLEQAGVPCAPVAEIPELLENPQVKARQIFFDMEYPGVGNVKLSHIPARASDLEPVENVRAPELGEHSREILLEAGYCVAEIDSLAAKRVILEHGK